MNPDHRPPAELSSAYWKVVGRSCDLTCPTVTHSLAPQIGDSTKTENPLVRSGRARLFFLPWTRSRTRGRFLGEKPLQLGNHIFSAVQRRFVITDHPMKLYKFVVVGRLAHRIS